MADNPTIANAESTDSVAALRIGWFSKILKLFGWITVWTGAILAGILWLCYTYVGDTTPLGEVVTIWPPVVWLAPLMALLSLGIFTRSWRTAYVSVVAILLVGSHEDLNGVFTARPSMERKVGTRVITWNIAGRNDWPQLLKELRPWKPDIVFMQETPDGDATLSTDSLSGFWTGYTWMDQGDCGILSRYPLTNLPSARIGPWDKPAMATAVIPKANLTTRSVLLCNVRLMLPASATTPDHWFDHPVNMRKSHTARVLQYNALAELLSSIRLKSGIEEVILGGDFNVRGGSFSLKPLTDSGLRDAWPESGGGWGATILAEFPMARIDQIWVSNQWLPMYSRTAVRSLSDHRMVVTDLVSR